jgi:hypothetical protein
LAVEHAKSLSIEFGESEIDVTDFVRSRSFNRAIVLARRDGWHFPIGSDAIGLW